MADNDRDCDYDFDLFRSNEEKEKSELTENSFSDFENENLKEEHNTDYTPEKKKKIAGVFEWLDVVVASLIAVVIIFTFVFRIVAIDGDSMNNTLFNGERVIITDLFYEPQKGDIVVISRNTDNSAKAGSYEAPIIKRIIATAGDIVDIDINAGTVSVNGEVLKEPYIKEPTKTKNDIQFPVRVPDNCVFVLGDNRNNSKDSRFSEIGEQGMINEKYILGKAVLRVFPFNKFGGIK